MAKIEKLLEGYQRFYNDNFRNNTNAFFDGNQLSQSPKTLMICCSDARVDPAILTNADIGDIFVIRNVANLVPPYQPEWDTNHGTSAAIEFAIKHLDVENIVVLGHSDCGGIKALVNNDIDMNEKFSFITGWVKIADEVKHNITNDIADKHTFCEQEGIKLSLRNLMTFPWIKKRVDAGSLTLHGWYFSLKDASLSILNSETDTFATVPHKTKP